MTDPTNQCDVCGRTYLLGYTHVCSGMFGKKEGIPVAPEAASEQDDAAWEPCPRCSTRYDTCDCDMDDDPVLKRSADHYAELVASEQDDAGAERAIGFLEMHVPEADRCCDKCSVRARARVAAVRRLRAENERLHDQLDQRLSHVEALEAAYEELREEWSSARAENERLRRAFAEAERGRLQASEAAHRLYDERDALRRRLAELEEVLRELLVAVDKLAAYVPPNKWPAAVRDRVRKLLEEPES